jgi:hypothetical protein
VRVYNGGMDTYTARDVARDYINEIFSKPGRLDDIQIIEIPRTCEHCKFWDGVQRHTIYGQCDNPKVCVVCTGEGIVYYPDTFGCIFWEGKG